MNTCKAELCDGAVFTKKSGLCQTHYHRMRSRGTLEPAMPTERTCTQCATAFTPRTTRHTYCTTACKYAAKYAQMRAATHDARMATVKTCPQCGDTFTPAQYMGRMYCTPTCGKRASRDASGNTCTTGTCDRPVRARHMCSMHYKRWSRAEGLAKPDVWNDRRRDNYHRRRARIHGASNSDVVTIDALMQRDNNTCNICDEHIDANLAYPNPMSKSIDHVLAISRGGEHTLANTAPSHLVCNIRKNDKDIGEVRVQHGQPTQR